MSGPHHRKLWLWRNFVDGVREYWAFDNAYPCRLDGGDPLVLGEPCGYAVFIESAKGRDYDDDGVLAAVMRSNAYHFDDELGRLQAEVSTLRQRAERAEAEVRFAAEALLLYNKDALPMATRMVEMEQALFAAQSTIIELTGQVERLRDFAKDFADEPCAYGDGCPPFAGTRHGTCNNCKARAALKDA